MNQEQMLLLSVLAVGTTAGVSAWLSIPGRPNDLIDFSQGSGVSQAQINRLRWYATDKQCDAEGCMLTVDQSSGAILSLLGGPSQVDTLRNVYPLIDSRENGSEPAQLVVYFCAEGQAAARACKIFIPVFNRVARDRSGAAPISGSLPSAALVGASPAPLPPAPLPVAPVAESILPPGMDESAYQCARTGYCAN